MKPVKKKTKLAAGVAVASVAAGSLLLVSFGRGQKTVGGVGDGQTALSENDLYRLV